MAYDLQEKETQAKEAAEQKGEEVMQMHTYLFTRYYKATHTPRFLFSGELFYVFLAITSALRNDRS